MNGSLTYSAPQPAQAPEEQSRSLGQILRDLFEKNPLANGIFMFAIVVGFFHGWLKVHYRSPITTFAFDIPIVLAMAVTVLSRGKDLLFPKAPVGDALKFHLAICLLYIPASLLIWEVPPLAVLAAFRGWCVIPLIFLIGYHLATSIRQVEFYMWAMIGLGFVTAVYGLFQSEEEVRQMMLMDPEMEFRFRNQFYASNGVSQFRRFSTYVSSAAFAAQLAYSTMFAVSRLSVKTCPNIERAILMAMAVVMSYALILTGARSGMLQLVLGVAFALWYRRGGVQFLVVPVVFYIAWKLGAEATSGHALDRYSTLVNSDAVWLRFWIVAEPSWNAFLEAPFGTGLGSSSHGVPMFLVSQLKYFRAIDGDLGHLVVDMGFIGVITICNLFYHCCASAWKWMSRLRDTPLSVISLPSGIFLLEAVVSFPIGTPFLGIPYGSMLWFFFGALSRLCLDYDAAMATGRVDSVSFREKFTSFISQPKMRSLYRRPEDPDFPTVPAVSGVPTRAGTSPIGSGAGPGWRPAPRTVAGVAGRSTVPTKRFLFSKSAKDRNRTP